MDVDLEKLKKKFLTIKDIRNKVSGVFSILETHLLSLKKMYSEIIVNNKQNLFVFGLDSLQFQSKLLDIEYSDMKRLFLAINNRMYCEYYKLYRIITDYVKENIPDKKTLDLIKVTNTFPTYKDLEPYKQYKFEMTQQIHENIILLLYEINEFILNKENELQLHKKKQEIGLNINNFVTTFNYNIIMIKEKGLLFISYIDFFHNLHTQYLQRFTMKMNLMYKQVTNDICFEKSPKKTDCNIEKKLSSSSEGLETSLNEETRSNSISLVENECNIKPKNKLTSIFTKNVKKMINGMRLKNTSNESLCDIKNEEIVQILEPKVDENKKTPEEIFMEISQKCYELTYDNQKCDFEYINDMKNKVECDLTMNKSILIDKYVEETTLL